jgi:threonylcarbamoyladenosine tRNA methylthiotransferase MtaB
MRFAIATLGCKVNHYDSAIIQDRLGALGLERREFDEVADVYVINTCTVTDRADAESLKLARRARRLNPGARVLMTGCLAQANPAVLAAAPQVDRVIGLARLDDLERAALGEDGERVMVSNLRKQKVEIALGPASLAGQTRAFLRLQEGCDQFCTFCVIPFSRGSSRSVAPRRVMAALDELHQRGFKEVILTGVHLGGYGKDLSPPATLEDLLEMIAERCPIGRVRLSSIDPEELSGRIIEIVAQSDKFCPHFHLPLQSGDDQILGAMRRRHKVDFYEHLVDCILEQVPSLAIGTDLIVGFPGEGQQQFERYFKFVEKLPLAYFHVFPYAVRTGTTAAKFDGRVSAAEITRRAQVMRQLGEHKRVDFVRRFRGTRLKVLLEEPASADSLKGYSRNYIRVLVEAPARLKNHEVEVEAVATDGAALVAKLVWPAA